MPYPLLSVPDPAQTAEGALDPLGLYTTADRLAIHMIPGVRERQRHPRFLTVMAVSLAVCHEFDERIAADGISEAYLVFEWHVVEGMVRVIKSDQQLRGLPGRGKVASVIDARQRLCARNYLKTPSVFGLHGVYRRLARELGVETQGLLDEAGYELLAAWEKDQGLTGFFGATPPGGRLRTILVDAVDQGLAKGAVAKGPSWHGWELLANHLHHLAPGPRERGILVDLLRNSPSDHRCEVLDFLVSPNGHKLVEAGAPERTVHEALNASASSALSELMQLIMLYETFARRLQNAFEASLAAMTPASFGVSSSELAGLPQVQSASVAVPRIYDELTGRLANLQMALPERFLRLGEATSAQEWVERLLEHHRDVQRHKPPSGKAPWFERSEAGRYIVRAAYRHSGELAADDAYVHFYRSKPLASFARDLGMVAS